QQFDQRESLVADQGGRFPVHRRRPPWRWQVRTLTSSRCRNSSPSRGGRQEPRYRSPYQGEARRRILGIPEARQVLAKRNWNRLHESGWLKNVVTFLGAEPDGQAVQP